MTDTVRLFDDITIPYLQRRQSIRITTDVNVLGARARGAEQRLATEAEQGPADELERRLGRPPTEQERQTYESLLRGQERADRRRDAEQAAEQAQEDERRAERAPSPPISAAGTTTPTAEVLRDQPQQAPLAVRLPELQQKIEARFQQKLEALGHTLESIGVPAGAAVPLMVLQSASEAFGAAVGSVLAEAGVDPQTAEAADLLASVGSSLLTLHPQIGALPAIAPFLGPALAALGKGGKAGTKALRSLALAEEATSGQESFQRFLQRGDWAILSAEKAEMAEPEKASATANLLKDLIERGYRPIQVQGRHGGAAERSFLVPGMDPDEALELGTKYRQDAVLVPQGLLNTADKTIHPADLSRVNIKEAPTFIGRQEGLTPEQGIDLYNTPVDLVDEQGNVLHPAGSTVSQRTLEAHGVPFDDYRELEVAGRPLRFQIPIDFERQVVSPQELPGWIGRKVVEGLRLDERIEAKWEALQRASGVSQTGMLHVALPAVIGGAALQAWQTSNTTADFQANFGSALLGVGLAAMLPPNIAKKAAKVMQESAGALRAAAGAQPAAVVRQATEAERLAFQQGLKAAELKGAIIRGDDIVQVNWATLREPGALDEVFRLLVEARPVESKVVPDKIVEELADELGMTADEFVKRNPTDTFNAAEAMAAKDLLIAGRERLVDLAERLAAAPNDAALTAEFDYHFGVMALLFERFMDIASEMGRAFRILREVPRDISRFASKELTDAARRQLVRELNQLGPQPAELVSLSDLMKRIARPLPEEQLRFSYVPAEPQLPFRDVTPSTRAPQEMVGVEVPLKPGQAYPSQLRMEFPQGALPPDVRRDIAAFFRSLQPKEQPGFLRRLFASPGFEAAYEVWVNALLATFQGHAANFLSNAAMLAREMANVQAAGVLGLFRGGKDRVLLGEASAMMLGTLHGYIDALLSGGRIGAVARASAGGLAGAAAGGATAGDLEGAIEGAIFGTGAGVAASFLPQLRKLPALTPGGGAKELPKQAFAARPLGLDPNSLLGWGVDLFSELFRFPGTAIRATDEFFKVIDKRAIQWKEAYHKAVTSGGGLREMRALVAEYMNEMDPRVKALADEFADYATFTQDLGEYTGAAAKVFQHPLLRFIVPFFRTPVNILKAELDSLPVLNRLAEQTRSELESTSAAVRDVARARLALGSLTAGAIAYYAWNGLITGAGPLDPNLKREWLDQGNMPYAVKVGDTWVSYDRFTPIGMHLGLVADYVQLMREWSLEDEEHMLHELDELGGAIALSFSRNVASRSWMMGVSDFLRTITSSKPDEWDRTFMTNLIASPIPPAVRQIRKSVDPVERDIRTWLDNIVSRIPGLSDSLPPRLNLKGEPVMYGLGNWWEAIIPVRIAKDKNDPVRKEILEHKISISLPGRVIEGPPAPQLGPEEQAKHGIELTPEQHYWYARLAGNDLKLPAVQVRATLAKFGVPEFKLTGKHAFGMWDTLEALVASDVYRRQTAEMKGILIKSVVYGYRQAARAVLLQNRVERQQAGVIVPKGLPEFPDLMNKYLMKFVDRAAALGGPEARQRAAEEVSRLKPGLFNIGR